MKFNPAKSCTKTRSQVAWVIFLREARLASSEQDLRERLKRFWWSQPNAAPQWAPQYAEKLRNQRVLEKTGGES